MKKLLTLLGTIVILGLSACGNSKEPYPYEDLNENEEHYIDEKHNENEARNAEQHQVQLPHRSPEPIPEQQSTVSLTLADFLYDFDYMMQAMEDSFPYFGMAERKLGVDIRELGREARAIIENYPYSRQAFAYELGIALEDMPEMDRHVFYSIIYCEFFRPLRGFGHNTIMNFMFFNPHATPGSTAFEQNARQTFSNPNVAEFYQEQASLFMNLAEYQPYLFHFYFPNMYLPTDSTTRFQPSPNTTGIIEEGRIAYINMPNFFVFNLRNYIWEFTSFYREIQNYDHLIIDIRENGGGNLEFARLMVMYPLIRDRDNMPDLPLYSFFKDSELGRFWGEAYIELEINNLRSMPETEYLLTIDDILSTSTLPYLNQDDLQHLGYGVRFNVGLGAITSDHVFRQTGRREMPHIPFHGQIWLLTSERNASASALFARQAKYTGFATLVGGHTGGLYTMAPVAYRFLPNTGIIISWDHDYLTDRYGRALNEFPTTPHYFNREDMDALETVLQMIAEEDH